LDLFYGKEVARYTDDSVINVYFKKTKSFFVTEKWPNLILHLKDGRIIEFDNKMENYSDLVDEVERWSGVALPNKSELLKGRGNECLVVTKL
jgi:hypothetical protein